MSGFNSSKPVSSGSERRMCTFDFMALHLARAVVEPAVFFDSPDTETSREHGLNLSSCLFSFEAEFFFFLESGFLWSLGANRWKEAKTGSLEKVPSYICFVSRPSCLLSVFHSFVSRLPFVWNVPGSSFPFPDSWSELLAAWRSGRWGRSRWFNSHVTLSAWQRRRGASGEGFTHTHTHTLDTYFIYIHIRMHTQIGSMFTHIFFHSRWRLLLVVLVQRHSNRARPQSKRRCGPPK